MFDGSLEDKVHQTIDRMTEIAEQWNFLHHIEFVVVMPGKIRGVKVFNAVQDTFYHRGEHLRVMQDPDLEDLIEIRTEWRNRDMNEMNEDRGLAALVVVCVAAVVWKYLDWRSKRTTTTETNWWVGQ